MNNDGKISVLMGIYNCSATLEQAIESIKNQTYSNWELILCDDGSSDNTYSIAESIANQDSRIILLKNTQNMGLNHTLNRCLSVATGEYIARMDGDDECLPQRFDRQLKALEDYTDCDIISSGMIFFDENGEWGKCIQPEFPTKSQVVTGSPICHAPVLIRKSAIDSVHGYTEDKRMIRVEDVNLWIKLYAAGFRCYNIQEPLYRMRNDQNALNRRKYKYRINSTYVRLKGCKMMHLGITCYIGSFYPMIIGLVPAKVRSLIRHKQQGEKL